MLFPINPGSVTEERDIRKAYEAGKGCINYMMDSVPFMTVEDEPRITEIVKGKFKIPPQKWFASRIANNLTGIFVRFVYVGWIKDGSIPEYELFTHEPAAKRKRRHKKYAKEALEAEAIKREMAAKQKGNAMSLEQQIMKRHADRETASNNFLDRLLEKYGGPDDSEEFVPGKKLKKVKTQAKKKQTSGKESMNKVKGGRVTKKK